MTNPEENDRFDERAKTCLNAGSGDSNDTCDKSMMKDKNNSSFLSCFIIIIIRITRTSVQTIFIKMAYHLVVFTVNTTPKVETKFIFSAGTDEKRQS